MNNTNMVNFVNVNNIVNIRSIDNIDNVYKIVNIVDFVDTVSIVDIFRSIINEGLVPTTFCTPLERANHQGSLKKSFKHRQCQ